MDTDWQCLPVAADDSLVALLHDAEEDDERIRAALRDPACQGYLAREGDEPVGAAVMRWTDPPELLYLAVAATARRQGHGRRIVAALQAELPRHGTTMLVGTANCALDNIAFYQRCGFRMHSVKRDYFDYIDPPLTENGIPMLDMIVFSYTS
ncbi:GNAT family N-acetyltransferase [Paractinoplanes lichenicola]|uniref:GNAT family N-acetyltransferase n=1 Tax=Paractinoplanes lichenicola TaxID=2802976 RepID=A0ABS1VH40_9ACTN|nr:GNAT family N-acetyltransferase [Actinoplanes lichenicola]MBL7252751.1 GNAT family N-acetyltransferase [Actinoplanes lichenicola]